MASKALPDSLYPQIQICAVPAPAYSAFQQTGVALAGKPAGGAALSYDFKLQSGETDAGSSGFPGIEIASHAPNTRITGSKLSLRISD
jgi:hypothetical protein